MILIIEHSSFFREFDEFFSIYSIFHYIFYMIMGNFILSIVVLILFFELVNRIWILDVHFQNINITDQNKQ